MFVVGLVEHAENAVHIGDRGEIFVHQRRQPTTNRRLRGYAEQEGAGEAGIDELARHQPLGVAVAFVGHHAPAHRDDVGRGRAHVDQQCLAGELRHQRRGRMPVGGGDVVRQACCCVRAHEAGAPRIDQGRVSREPLADLAEQRRDSAVARRKMSASSAVMVKALSPESR